MEENKNVEIEQTKTNEEINKKEVILTEPEEMVQEIDSDFADIDKDSMKKIYIIVGILYLVVVILSVLLVIGIKNQKDTIKDKIDNNSGVNEKIDEENNDEVVIPEETPKDNQPKEDIVPDTNNNKNELDDELNILDQI